VKPKTNRKGDIHKSHKMDQCQTPPYALNPLRTFLSRFSRVWESAAGEGYLVRALEEGGFEVTGTDLLTGDNFFTMSVPKGCEVQITNPPFSAKYDWLRRSYELELPFALLLPIEVLGAAAGQKLIRECGAEIIFYDQRVDFKMPEKGWNGGGAQFPTMWLTWGLNIGQQMTFARLDKPTKAERDKLYENT